MKTHSLNVVSVDICNIIVTKKQETIQSELQIIDAKAFDFEDHISFMSRTTWNVDRTEKVFYLETNTNHWSIKGKIKVKFN